MRFLHSCNSLLELDIFEELMIILFCPQKRREAYARG